jgi:hypothetical protein
MDGGMDSGASTGFGAGSESTLSLRELFASMSHGGGADPATVLAQAGHGDLPGHLVTEAIINYADSAPVEVAEHLTPYVVANSAVPAPDGHSYPVTELDDGFSLLGSAPTTVETDAVDDPFDVHHDVDAPALDDASHTVDIDGLHDGLHAVHDTTAEHADHSVDHDAHHGEDGNPADLWFGHGQATALTPSVIGDPVSTDDPSAGHFSAGHTDPWLIDTPGEVPAHGAVDVPLFGEGVEAHEDAHGHEDTHTAQQLPVDDAPEHHDIDPTHGA